MAYIPYVPYEEAEGLLARLYRRYGGPGRVDNIVRIHSLNPGSMEGHVRYYAHLMRGPSPLTRVQREMIAVTVSAHNDCFYWINHHGAGLRTLTGDPDLPRRLARDHTRAELSEADRAMLDYALKLSAAPGSVDEGDVEELRVHGFDDTAILDICQVTAYYAYVNRLADGLGVELEEGWTEEELTVTREEFEARKEARSADDR